MQQNPFKEGTYKARYEFVKELPGAVEKGVTGNPRTGRLLTSYSLDDLQQYFSKVFFDDFEYVRKGVDLCASSWSRIYLDGDPDFAVHSALVCTMPREVETAHQSASKVVEFAYDCRHQVEYKGLFPTPVASEQLERALHSPALYAAVIDFERLISVILEARNSS